MSTSRIARFRQWCIRWHRDLGYFFAFLIIIYCISGLALNHINDWNPDFVVKRTNIPIHPIYQRSAVTPEVVKSITATIQESPYRAFDFPTEDQLKIYYPHSTFHLNLSTGIGTYERLERRWIFYESNVLHRNSLSGWKWVSDVFGILLIVITVTGLFVLKGRNGFSRRGIWLFFAGAALPVAGWVIFYCRN